MLRRFGRFLIGGYDASVKRAPRLGSLFLFVELVDEFVPFAIQFSSFTLKNQVRQGFKF